MGYLFKSKTWSYFDILYLSLNLYKYFTDLGFQLVTAHWIWYAKNLKAFMSRLLVLLSNFSFTCLSWLLSKFWKHQRLLELFCSFASGLEKPSQINLYICCADFCSRLIDSALIGLLSIDSKQTQTYASTGHLMRIQF